MGAHIYGYILKEKIDHSKIIIEDFDISHTISINLQALIITALKFIKQKLTYAKGKKTTTT